MDEQKRILVANERTKALSTVIVNLGTALVAAAFATWWASGNAGFPVWLWLVFGVLSIGMGVHMLGQLESEA